MPWHNKVPGYPTAIYACVIGSGSYYSLFACLDTRRTEQRLKLAKRERNPMKKEIRLYNVLFPFWMLLLFPQLWLIVIPGNFLIDSLVLFVSMICFKIQNKKAFYKQNILKIFCFGILSDLVGSVFMLIMMLCLQIGRMGDELYLTLPALIISAVCIFLLNYFVTFRKCDKHISVKLALVFAIITAPYTFLVPSSWLYG